MANSNPTFIFNQISTGWLGWYTYPSEKCMKVSWDDDIPNIRKKSCSKPPTRNIRASVQ